MCPPLKIVVLTEAVTLKMTASVNRFCKAVSLTASVNKKCPPQLMLVINRRSTFYASEVLKKGRNKSFFVVV